MIPQAGQAHEGKYSVNEPLRCLQLSDGKAVMVGRKIAFPQAYLVHSA